MVRVGVGSRWKDTTASKLLRFPLTLEEAVSSILG
jgi:hypothetical protein